MEKTIFYIIISIVIFDYLLARLMDYLNSTKRSEVLPKELEGIYDAEKYKTQQQYEKENTRFGLITGTLSFVLMIGMLMFDGFAFVDGVTRSVTENAILLAMLFFGIIMLASDILEIPFDYYNTFVIEEKYGFNKTTTKTFVTDKLKGWLIAAIVGGGLLSLLIWFFGIAGEYFWLWAWGAVSVFMVFMVMFYSNLIVPLFNKQTPLEDGELRNEIELFSQKVGFKLDNIFVIDGSKRSTKANAYFSGLGSKKRIVLYDTLINDMTKEEIVAVLAHEIGHYKKKHTLSTIFISLLQTGLTFYILSLFINNASLSQALHIEQHSFHVGLLVFGMLYSPISMFIGIFMNIFSRRNEYQADKYAADNYHAEHLISALKKLSVKNLSNLTPHPFYVFVTYSHPPLLKRIGALRQ